MKARDIMTHPVITVREQTPLSEVAQTMLERHIGSVLVVNAQGELCGILTEGDFAGKERGFPFSPFSLYGYPQVLGEWLPPEGVERIYEAARTRKAEEIMTTEVITVSEDDSVEQVLTLLVGQEFHHLPVLKGKKPVGILTRHDLLKLMANRGQ